MNQFLEVEKQKQQIVRYSILKPRQITVDENPEVLNIIQCIQKSTMSKSDCWPTLNNQLQTPKKSVVFVKMFKQIMGRQKTHTKLLFLFQISFGKKINQIRWYKNSSIHLAKNIKLDVQRLKVANHFNRADTVAEFLRNCVSEQKLVKM